MYFNPYNVNKPATGPSFIGRDYLINRLSIPSQNSLVVGYSRFGKTSSLLAAKKSLEQNGHPAIYIGFVGPDLKSLSQQIRMQFASSTVPKLSADLTKTLNILDSYYQQQGKNLFIFLDETHDLLTNTNDARRLRAAEQVLQNISMTYAVFPSTFAKMTQQSSRLQDTKQMYPLKPFGLDETAQLVNLCTNVDVMRSMANGPQLASMEFRAFQPKGDVIHDVLEITGGFPYLEQALLSEMVNQSVESNEPFILTPELLRQSYKNHSHVAQEQISHLWNALTDLEKKILLLVQKNPNISRDDLEQQTSAGDPSEFLGAFNPISEKGLGLVKGQNNFVIRGEILTNALQRFGEMYARR